MYATKAALGYVGVDVDSAQSVRRSLRKARRDGGQGRYLRYGPRVGPGNRREVLRRKAEEREKRKERDPGRHDVASVSADAEQMAG